MSISTSANWSVTKTLSFLLDIYPSPAKLQHCYSTTCGRRKTYKASWKRWVEAHPRVPRSVRALGVSFLSFPTSNSRSTPFSGICENKSEKSWRIRQRSQNMPTESERDIKVILRRNPVAQVWGNTRGTLSALVSSTLAACVLATLHVPTHSLCLFVNVSL